MTTCRVCKDELGNGCNDLMCPKRNEYYQNLKEEERKRKIEKNKLKTDAEKTMKKHGVDLI